MRLNKLACGLAAVLFVASCSEMGTTDSALSGHEDAAVQGGDCTLTQGYWKNHPGAWPVSSLKLGSVSYDKDELLAILKTPVKGNGLIQLAHQLIAAKLNIAAGADDASIEVSITAADALIGSLVVGEDSLKTSATAELTGKLDAYNNGAVGPGHCDDNSGGGSGSDDDCDHDDDGDCDSDDEPCDEEPPAPVCGNDVVEAGEACDDGNTVAHDGCSAACQIELPVCGNGVVEAGEECDDGNTVNGDGCSSVCFCDCPH
jgi:cysteine-rich repeat protein